MCYSAAEMCGQGDIVYFINYLQVLTCGSEMTYRPGRLINYLSSVIDRCAHRHAHTYTHTHSPLPVFILLSLFLSLDSSISPHVSAPTPPFHTGGGGNLCDCVSVVYLPSCEALAKVSELSANFTTCVKLKAVMWKRCLPSFSLGLSSCAPYSPRPFILLYPPFCLFPSFHLPHPVALPFTPPL